MKVWDQRLCQHTNMSCDVHCMEEKPSLKYIEPEANPWNILTSRPTPNVKKLDTLPSFGATLKTERTLMFMNIETFSKLSIIKILFISH